MKKGKTTSLKGLKKTLFTKPAQWVFEIKVVESTDEDIKNNSYNNYKNRRKIKMSRKIKWGVLGTANIARKVYNSGNEKGKELSA